MGNPQKAEVAIVHAGSWRAAAHPGLWPTPPGLSVPAPLPAVMLPRAPAAGWETRSPDRAGSLRSGQGNLVRVVSAEDCGLGCSRSSPGDLPRGIFPSLPSEALLPRGPNSGNWGARPFLRTCPHLALSFARPYLGLSFGPSTKMSILEEDCKGKTGQTRTTDSAS